MVDSVLDRSAVSRSVSLPDLGELEDIQAFDDALCSHDHAMDDRDEQKQANESDEELGYHPVRVFSMGLHRSISMPKQGPWMASSSLESEETFSETSSSSPDAADADLDGFYIPEGDETDDEQSSGLDVTTQAPQFYSTEKLKSLLPPSSSPAETKGLAARRLERAGEPETSSAERRGGEKSQTKQSYTSAVERQQNVHRNQAAAALAAFFGQPRLDSRTALASSPKSVAGFPAQPSQLSGAPPPTPTPSAPSSSSSSSSLHPGDREFVRLQKQNRANSLPSSPYHAYVLPRKPSLKRVSSFIGGSSGTQKGKGSTTGNSDGVGMKPSVSFSNLRIREYDVTLGDNPSVSFGPPISLGWEYRDTTVVTVDSYEQTRLSLPRRNMRQLILSYNMRKYLLLKTAGYNKTEIRDAIKEVNRIKRERQVTDMFLPASKLDEVMEGVMDQVKGIFSSKKDDTR